MKHHFKYSIVFLTIVVSSACWFQLNAQTFKPGLIAGMTTSQVGGDNFQGFNKLGLTFGGFVRYKLSENWFTQFEIAFVQKGSRNDFSISETDPTQSEEYFLMRLNYIEIPLLFRFNHRKFVYELGLYYGQLIGLKYEIRWTTAQGLYPSQGPYTSLDELNNQDYQFKEPVKAYDFGFAIGLGYKLSDNLLGSLRFTNSILPFKKTESGLVDRYPTSLNFGWTNTVIVGTFRYTFGEGNE